LGNAGGRHSGRLADLIVLGFALLLKANCEISKMHNPALQTNVKMLSNLLITTNLLNRYAYKKNAFSHFYKRK
jgi:hypothetical protein